MSLFIKQDQITSNLRNDSETNAPQGKHHKPTPKKENPDKSRTIKSNSSKFQTNVNKTAKAQNMEKLHKNANLTKFQTAKLSIYDKNSSY